MEKEPSLFQALGINKECERCGKLVDSWFIPTIKCRECESIL